MQANKQIFSHDSIPPLYDKNSKILILGSFPSVKSRQESFYYMHPQNRFYKVLSSLYNVYIGDTVKQRKDFLLKNHIALWDVVKTCKIDGSKDSSIEVLELNDIKSLLLNTKINKIYTNGLLSDKKYEKFIYKNVEKKSIYLPSTSSANARYSLPKLIAKWAVIRQ